ncbi:bifunctional folylpolyglutamate synthase/dihydrofolate synthase [Sphingomicrobium flavum]|uniref:bifunctional folylpolyglutamate synthase/dihydrofolate synthase n=1 Tax=Sphingomicrobium flavum TaxID=1229164 RepID=UPI0021ADDB08|nr:folylpolyglutamate synthase/dihydrofolate synthase family protein [Sphingomicrobium flavum]
MADGARSSHPAVQAELDRLMALGMGGDVLGLERIEELCERLGRPQDRLAPVFHVAGTNGKGSTIAFLRAMLEASGQSVHVFTSPHLVRFNERIRLAGSLIEDEALAPLLAEVIDAAQGMKVSFFEATTAAAFLAFARTPANACLIEVGLGGRLDATNIVQPVMTGIAALGMDHMHFLGDTLAAIAGEKTGIAKPGVPLVTHDYPADADAVIDAKARALGVNRLKRGRDWKIEADGDGLLYRDEKGELALPRPSLPGMHQAANAGLAVAMLRHQQAIEAERFAESIAAANWPARLQQLPEGDLTRLLPDGVPVRIDGAHNRNAAEAVAEALKDGGPLTLVTGILKNRAMEDVLAPFAGQVKRLLTLPITGHDHHDPKDLCVAGMKLFGLDSCGPSDDPRQAFERIGDALRRDGIAPGERVLVVGSLYLAGQVLEQNGTPPA